MLPCRRPRSSPTSTSAPPPASTSCGAPRSASACWRRSPRSGRPAGAARRHVELRDRPARRVRFEIARPILHGDRRRRSAGHEVVLVPGNHDHRLLGPWLERRRGTSAGRPRSTSSRASRTRRSARSPTGSARRGCEVRYPGVWVRDDVYATHGHYLDSHMTLPTVERLGALVDGGLGTRRTPRPWRRPIRPLDPTTTRRSTPGLRPDLHLAQGGAASAATGRGARGRCGSGNGRRRLRKARTIRGRLLGSAGIPATLRGLERAGLGRFNRDLSITEIGRAGVAAMHEVVTRLEIEAEHVDLRPHPPPRLAPRRGGEAGLDRPGSATG